MNCASCRDALSARLDGEESPGEGPALDAHLASCPSCRRWYDDAAEVGRLLRVALPTPPSRGIPDSVLAVAPSPWWARLSRTLYGLLGVLGAGQFLLGVTQIGALARGTHTHTDQVASAGHLWHESAAWNLAIGAAFGLIAARRVRPAAMVPVLTVFVAVLTLLSLGDVGAGRVQVAWLLSHGFLIAGYGVLLLLRHPLLDFGDPPTGPRSGRWRPVFDDPADEAADLPGPSGRRWAPGSPTPTRREVA
ncbi:zf-HC2 domain-containing protein [Micromonospora cathayae]|uniref:Zf-HC2 domain-containing protein n=1 Tax=Micromonospora cathayae TaxID=3028804 RepID=A0ABY7ZI27_9ACTN|nr:zf-HC2 domain-containing protein [Micromonospora sp. HUAS 3]WDZ82528.1 zf-HC2 domain-containing protein [Micromonospora sp. HUAS 3]